jgi:hypothetical protein
MMASDGQLTTAGEDIFTTADKNAIRAAIPVFKRMGQAVKNQYQLEQWAKRWNMFQKIDVICKTMLELNKAQNSDADDDSSDEDNVPNIGGTEDEGKGDGDDDLLTAARMALENKDDITLNQILQDV